MYTVFPLLTDGQQIWEVEATVDRDKTQTVSQLPLICTDTCISAWCSSIMLHKRWCTFCTLFGTVTNTHHQNRKQNTKPMTTLCRLAQHAIVISWEGNFGTDYDLIYTSERSGSVRLSVSIWQSVIFFSVVSQSPSRTCCLLRSLHIETGPFPT